MDMSSDHDQNRDRDDAASDDAALVRYEATWARAIARLQRAHPRRWSVRGWSEEEVRDALTLRLVEVVRGERDAFERYDRDGKPWALVVMRTRLDELRKANRLDARPTTFEEAPLPSRLPDQEEEWLAREEDARREIARQRAERTLTIPQRRWYAAMRMAANAGAFFRSSDALNLAAASRTLGKNRSSAQRAYRELQTVFARERERIG